MVALKGSSCLVTLAEFVTLILFYFISYYFILFDGMAWKIILPNKEFFFVFKLFSLHFEQFRRKTVLALKIGRQLRGGKFSLQSSFLGTEFFISKIPDSGEKILRSNFRELFEASPNFSHKSFKTSVKITHSEIKIKHLNF